MEGEEKPGRNTNDPDFWEGNGIEWRSKRMEITYREARSVLESQQTTLADIDEKAMRTVRTTTLFIGAIASAVKVAHLTIHPTFGALGPASLFCSLACGLATYDESDPYLGPSKPYIEQLIDDDFEETQWDEDLIETLASWIEQNGEDIRFNSGLLRMMQILLFVGVGCTTFALLLNPPT